MPAMQSFDEAFFSTAPHRWSRTWDVSQDAAAFWDELVSRPLHWCRALGLAWTSAPPYGVGSTRDVTVLHALHAVEEFFLWEEGRRQAFHFARSNLPGLRRFGEYYEIEPTGTDTCRFTWKLAAEPTTLGRVTAPGLDLLVTDLFRDTTHHCQVAP